jgi:hypothetical protein
MENDISTIFMRFWSYCSETVALLYAIPSLGIPFLVTCFRNVRRKKHQEGDDMITPSTRKIEDTILGILLFVIYVLSVGLYTASKENLELKKAANEIVKPIPDWHIEAATRISAFVRDGRLILEQYQGDSSGPGIAKEQSAYVVWHPKVVKYLASLKGPYSNEFTDGNQDLEADLNALENIQKEIEGH